MGNYGTWSFSINKLLMYIYIYRVLVWLKTHYLSSNYNMIIIKLLNIIFVLKGKPLKPQILGNRRSLVGSIIELTCSSQSTSAPDYYSKLVTLSYTWFQNETIVNRETKKRLIVTRAEKYNKYSCTATEEDLESDRSDPVQINPLCMYGQCKITSWQDCPTTNTKRTLLLTNTTQSEVLKNLLMICI